MHASLTSLGEQWRVKAASVDSNDPSEDRATIVEAADGALFAVFDGHGGSACSEWCNTTMLPAAAAFITEGRSVEKALSEAAVVAETSWLEKVRAGEPHTAGACACVAHVQATAKNGLQNSTDSKRSVTVANIGDCRCVLGTVGSNGELKAIALSRDHNARMPEEQRRLILEHPGEPDVVTRADRWSSNWYVKGVLQPSRTFGDFHLKLEEFNQGEGKLVRGRYTPPYIRSEPQVISRDVIDEDKFIIIATDGLWDNLSNEEAVKIVGRAERNGKDSAEALVQKCLGVAAQTAGCPRKLLEKLPAGSMRRRIHDDITVLVVML